MYIWLWQLYHTQCSSEGFVALFLSTKIIFTSSAISFVVKRLALTAEESANFERVQMSRTATPTICQFLGTEFAQLKFRKQRKAITRQRAKTKGHSRLITVQNIFY